MLVGASWMVLHDDGDYDDDDDDGNKGGIACRLRKERGNLDIFL